MSDPGVCQLCGKNVPHQTPWEPHQGAWMKVNYYVVGSGHWEARRVSVVVQSVDRRHLVVKTQPNGDEMTLPARANYVCNEVKG